MNKKGFTLIELLVVVLIIGILAAIALPKYEMAVEKSRASEMRIMLRHIHDAEKMYKLSNPTQTNIAFSTFEDLGIDIPGGYSEFVGDGEYFTICNEHFCFQLHNDAWGLAGGVIGTPVGRRYSNGYDENGEGILYQLEYLANTEDVRCDNYTAKDYCKSLFGTASGGIIK